MWKVRLSLTAAVAVAVLFFSTTPAQALFCWDFCDGTQDCDTPCNLGGGVSTCGMEGYPCCSSETGMGAYGAKWDGIDNLWCNETIIGYWVTCRRCPPTFEEQCVQGPCTEIGGGWAFGYVCASLNWGQQYC